MKTIITFLTIIIFTFSISSCVEKEEYETQGEKMANKLKSLVKEYNIQTAYVLINGKEYNVNYDSRGSSFEIDDDEIWINGNRYRLEYLVYYDFRGDNPDIGKNFMVLRFNY